MILGDIVTSHVTELTGRRMILANDNNFPMPSMPKDILLFMEIIKNPTCPPSRIVQSSLYILHVDKKAHLPLFLSCHMHQ